MSMWESRCWGDRYALILRVVPKLSAAIDQSAPPDEPVSIDPNGD